VRDSLLELIPGYAAAIEAEQLVRDAAFYPVPELVGGFKCRPMTLTDYMILRTSKNPLLYGQVPTPEQLAAFLWLLSPEYRPTDLKGRAKFLKRCRKHFMPPPYRALLNTKRAQARQLVRVQRATAIFDAVVKAALDYVAETLQDRPPRAATIVFEADYFSDAAGLCAQFARQYGWSEQAVLAMPLKRIFQYLNEMQQHSGSKKPLCNPSDQVRADWLRAANRRN
jgi:hypothetical protein